MRSGPYLVLILSLLSMSGCARPVPVVTENSAMAKYVLDTALGAWKSGNVKSLAERTPPIRFADDDQIAGLELVDYEFENEAAQIRPYKNVPVILSLKDKQGRTFRRRAEYQVGIEPKLTVLRSDT